jgi:hypothetical protein
MSDQKSRPQQEDSTVSTREALREELRSIQGLAADLEERLGDVGPLPEDTAREALGRAVAIGEAIGALGDLLGAEVDVLATAAG